MAPALCCTVRLHALDLRFLVLLSIAALLSPACSSDGSTGGRDGLASTTAPDRSQAAEPRGPADAQRPSDPGSILSPDGGRHDTLAADSVASEPSITSSSQAVSRSEALTFWPLRPLYEHSGDLDSKPVEVAWFAKSERPWRETDPRREVCSVLSVYQVPGNPIEPGQWGWLEAGGVAVIATSYPNVPDRFKPNTTVNQNSEAATVKGRAAVVSEAFAGERGGRDLTLLRWNDEPEAGLTVGWTVIANPRFLSKSEVVAFANDLKIVT